MKATTVKRLECAWLLRDFAWALKRYADRIERCCTENPNDENERKALVWYARAQERMQKFILSRGEYMMERVWIPPQRRNPWHAGWPIFHGNGEVYIFVRGLILRGKFLLDSTGAVFGVNCDGVIFSVSDRIDAWRPA